ncbi:MAG: cytidine deaminase [Actinobacteria bacterium]|nr:MAG: cytidine deaminase [Actinomycetota bacterium]
MTDEELLERATQAASEAYAPYSHLHVGAAVLLRDGRVVTGVNVENASYPLGICAERAALARAVTEGARPGDVEAVAVAAAGEEVSPCGGCRQWLTEFGVDRVLFLKRGELVSPKPEELLPDAFTL